MASVEVDLPQHYNISSSSADHLYNKSFKSDVKFHIPGLIDRDPEMSTRLYFTVVSVKVSDMVRNVRFGRQDLFIDKYDQDGNVTVLGTSFPTGAYNVFTFMDEFRARMGILITFSPVTFKFTIASTGRIILYGSDYLSDIAPLIGAGRGYVDSGEGYSIEFPHPFNFAREAIYIRSSALTFDTWVNKYQSNNVIHILQEGETIFNAPSSDNNFLIT